MKTKKIFGFIAAILMALPLFIGALGAGKVANAVEVPPPTAVNVTLHKRVWEEELPGKLPNDGVNMPDFGTNAGVPLNGVTFAVYDVAASYYALLATVNPTTSKNYTIEEAIQHIQSNVSLYASSTNLITEKETGGEDAGSPLGQAVFENLSLKKIIDGKERDAVYLFVETDAPSKVKQLAAPIVLAMPIYTEGENPTLNPDIHLYPKNLIKEDTKVIPELEAVKLDEETYNYEIGAKIPYAINVHIPSNIATLSEFTITDVPDLGLDLVDLTEVVITVDTVPNPTTLSTPTHYTIGAHTVAGSGNGFRVNFVPSSLAEFAGNQITISYEMVLTADIDPDAVFNNTATVGTHTVTGPKVATGGHRFTKTDAHTGNGLAGAEFVVKNEDGEFATFTQNSSTGLYSFSGWEDDEADATTIISGENGVLNIIGLTDGSYKLVETAAPGKYVLGGPVSFTVTHGQYGETNLEVTNTPKGLLPETGGNGILAFLAIGLSLMLGAFVWYKKTKKPMEV